MTVHATLLPAAVALQRNRCFDVVTARKACLSLLAPRSVADSTAVRRTDCAQSGSAGDRRWSLGLRKRPYACRHAIPKKELARHDRASLASREGHKESVGRLMLA